MSYRLVRVWKVIVGAAALLFVCDTGATVAGGVLPVHAFTTVTNAGFTAGPLSIGDFAPFFSRTALQSPLVRSGSVTIDRNLVASGKWVVTNALTNTSVTLTCSAAGPFAVASPSVAVKVNMAGCGNTGSTGALVPVQAGALPPAVSLALNGSTIGMSIATRTLPSRKINGIVGNGFQTTVTTFLDAQHTQVTLVEGFFAPNLQDPAVPCLVDNVGTDPALQAVLGELDLLRKAQPSVNPMVHITGPKLPIGEFLLFAQVAVFAMNEPPSGKPFQVLTLENGNIE